jgi:putative Ca2+/H+ antiporter (TMEM165/GDT1 family)
METHHPSSILRGVCSALVALASVATFTLVWVAKGLSHEARDFVSFAAFVVFVIAFHEALECVQRRRRSGSEESGSRG